MRVLHRIVLEPMGWTVSTSDSKRGVTSLQLPGSLVCRSRQTSQEKDAQSVSRSFKAEPFHKLASGNTRGDWFAENLRREKDRNSIWDVQCGSMQSFGEADVILR
jgi:hypothetical protein